MIKSSVSSLPYNDNIIKNLPEIINSGTDFLHIDIMDGSLTENKTFDYKTLEKINSKTTLFLDCHLMINEPKNIVKNYCDSGANIVSIHYEAFKDKLQLIDTLTYLKNRGVIVGLAIYPKTQIEEIELYKNYFDLLLIMSVEIGKYGQTFIDSTFDKIVKAKELLKDKLIEVDGGVNLENSTKLKELGVDIVVVGGSFYKANNKQEFITNLKK